MSSGTTSPIYNVIKVGSRFHLIDIKSGDINELYYNTREEAERGCDNKNDYYWDKTHSEAYLKEQYEKKQRLMEFMKMKRNPDF